MSFACHDQSQIYSAFLPAPEMYILMARVRSEQYNDNDDNFIDLER